MSDAYKKFEDVENWQTWDGAELVAVFNAAHHKEEDEILAICRFSDLTCFHLYLTGEGKDRKNNQEQVLVPKIKDGAEL